MFYYSILGADGLAEGENITLNGIIYTKQKGILRQKSILSNSQYQTEKSFGFKWAKRDTYESQSVKAAISNWLIERYLDGEENLSGRYCFENAKMLDAGCGSGVSSLLLFGKTLEKVRYLGVDISDAVDIARDRFNEMNIGAEFIQADITNLPFNSSEFDMIFSEGVLHHTDSTEKSLKYLVTLLKPNGFFLFYVYRKKAPIREYSDDYIREQLSYLDNKDAWEALIPISMLGRELGKLNTTIRISEDIPILGIPSGTYDLQRFFYWFFMKAYYRPDFSLEEMNHINFDWYRPMNCHRHTENEIEKWCFEANMKIIRMKIEEAGITVIAQKMN